jgi:hypothetical protein
VRLIDLDAVADHPESVLLTMKAEHEARIAVVAGIEEDRASHVIRFGASICDNEALVSTQAIFSAMPPERHPANGQTLGLEMVELGRLLCDIVPAAVHQRHREPASWRWASGGPPITFRTTEPDDRMNCKFHIAPYRSRSRGLPQFGPVIV